MKMLEYVKNLRKDFVHENYSSIVSDFKKYDKISKTKMIEEVYKVYGECQNIIEICTERELKYLKLLLEGNAPVYNDMITMGEYTWEEENLKNKLLIFFNHETRSYEIPEEIYDSVQTALKTVKWKEVKECDRVNEVLVGLAKVYGCTDVFNILFPSSILLDINKNQLITHILNNRCCRFYISVIRYKDNANEGEISLAVMNEYYGYIESLYSKKEKYNCPDRIVYGLEELKTIFYNDFDINNKKIKKFIDMVHSLPICQRAFLCAIKEMVLFNADRTKLYEYFQKKNFEAIDAKKAIKITGEAMDEMLSGALNGLSPNEAKKIYEENVRLKNMPKGPIQKNACIGEKEGNIFNNLYLALLEYTNKKYNIKPGLKIYKCNYMDPSDISAVIGRLWQDAENIIKEFCEKNIYRFNEEELNIIRNFAKGKRGQFTLVKYDSDYTVLMDEDRVYMIKGLDCNIAEFFFPNMTPMVVEMTILPYKNNIVFDGSISVRDLSMSESLKKTVEKEYQTKMKYYHL